MKSAITISLVEEARGGPFVFWHDLPAACRTASLLGFDGIEIFPPSAEALAGASEIAKAHGLQVAAIGTGAGWVKHKLRLTDPDPDIRKKAVAFICSLLQAGSELNASVIIGSMQGRWGDGVSCDLALAWLSEALYQIDQKAEELGASLLFEPLNRYETNLFNTQKAAADFLKNLTATNTGLLCDLFHMNIEEASIPESFKEVFSSVGHVHFADTNRRAVGFGHLEMEPIARALKAINYSGFISAECLPLPDSQTAAKQTIESFRRWFT